MQNSSSRGSKLVLCRCPDCGPSGTMQMPNIRSQHMQGVVEGATLAQVLLTGASVSQTAVAGGATIRPKHIPRPGWNKSPSRPPSPSTTSLNDGAKSTTDELLRKQSERRAKAIGDLNYLRKFLDAHERYLESPPTRLTFEHPPSTSSGPYIPQETFSEMFNAGPYALASAAGNEVFLSVYRALYDTHVAIEHPFYDFDSCRKKRQELRERVSTVLGKLEKVKAAEWKKQRVVLHDIQERAGKATIIETRRLFDPAYTADPLVVSCLFLVVALHLLCGVSRDHSIFVLMSLKVIVELALGSDGRTLSVHSKSLLEGIPGDVRTAMKQFDLDPVTTTFVFCPKCCKCYQKGGDGEIPAKCTHRETPGSPVCGSALTANRNIRGRAHTYAIREFIFFDFHHWLGRLLSRPGLEALIDSAWDPSKFPPDSKCHDIFQGEVLSTFKGPDGKLFSDSPEGEARLVFSLCTDGFNLYHNKQSGKRSSTTGIYMVCLNLPPHLRFLPENMYLAGLVPGPHPLTGHKHNHFLDILVDQLETSFHPGLFFTKTASYPLGRRARAALVGVVSDVVAARSSTGLGPSTRGDNLCSFCGISKGAMENFDRTQWPDRDDDAHRKLAEQWRDASTEAERDDIFSRYGIRWTPFFRLSYWNPRKMVVIDSMHNLLLGVLKRHCLTLWGMNDDRPDGDGLEGPQFKKRVTKNVEPSQSDKDVIWAKFVSGPQGVQKLKANELKWLCAKCDLPYRDRVKGLKKLLKEHHATRSFDDAEVEGCKKILARTENQAFQDAEQYIERGDSQRLEKCLCSTLRQCAEKRGIQYKGTKKAMARQLCEVGKLAVTTFLEPDEPAPTKRPVVLGQGVISEFRSDAQKSQRPSWLGRAPFNLGSTLHGKLSADQWRTAFTVDFVVTLVRLWSTKGERFSAMLGNFMELVGALRIAHKHAVSLADINAYEEHMKLYLEKSLQLYPGHALLPNNHLALHIKDFLLLFGPMQAWRCFPFERLNGILQRFNSNMRPNDMEKTVGMTFARGSALRALVSDESVAPALRKLKVPFDAVFSDDNRGTLLSDIFSSTAPAALQPKKEPGHLVDAPKDVRGAFRKLQGDRGKGISLAKYQVNLLSEITLKGKRFTTHSNVPSDSNISFIYPSTGGHVSGRIRNIILDPWESQPQPYVVVERFRTLSEEHVKFDYYRKWAWAGSLYYDEFEGAPVVIAASSIVSHVVKTQYEDPNIGQHCVHILPLDWE